MKDKLKLISIFSILLLVWSFYFLTTYDIKADDPLPNPSTDVYRKGGTGGPPAYNQTLLWKYFTASELGGSTPAFAQLMATIDADTSQSPQNNYGSFCVYNESISSSVNTDLYMIGIDISDTVTYPHTKGG